MAGHTTETTTISLNAHATTASQDNNERQQGKDGGDYGESSSKLDLDQRGSSSELTAQGAMTTATKVATKEPCPIDSSSR